MKAEFNLGGTELKRLASLGIRSRRQNAFARPEGSFPVVNIRCRFAVRAHHRTHLVRRLPGSSSLSSKRAIYFWNLGSLLNLNLVVMARGCGPPSWVLHAGK